MSLLRLLLYTLFVGTWSRGFSRGACKPCKPGLISPQGSASPEECEIWEWECPVGQWAPEGARSPEDCKCYPGRRVVVAVRFKMFGHFS
jgi:hypothetical protein